MAAHNEGSGLRRITWTEQQNFITRYGEVRRADEIHVGDGVSLNKLNEQKKFFLNPVLYPVK